MPLNADCDVESQREQRPVEACISYCMTSMTFCLMTLISQLWDLGLGVAQPTRNAPGPADRPPC